MTVVNNPNSIYKITSLVNTFLNNCFIFSIIYRFSFYLFNNLCLSLYNKFFKDVSINEESDVRTKYLDLVGMYDVKIDENGEIQKFWYFNDNEWWKSYSSKLKTIKEPKITLEMIEESSTLEELEEKSKNELPKYIKIYKNKMKALSDEFEKL